MTPTIGRPSYVRPISVAQLVMPHTKERVPSTGSSTQLNGERAGRSPYSSPTMPWSGKVASMSARMARSPARSAAVTGSKPEASLLSMPGRVRKWGRISRAAAAASTSANRAYSCQSISCGGHGTGGQKCKRRDKLGGPTLDQGAWQAREDLPSGPGARKIVQCKNGASDMQCHDPSALALARLLRDCGYRWETHAE
jgi:hypothetical protein